MTVSETSDTDTKTVPKDSRESATQTVKSGLLGPATMGILVGASFFVAGLVMGQILSAISLTSKLEGQIDSGYAYAALDLVVVGLFLLFTSATALLARGPSHSLHEIPSIFTTFRRVFSMRFYSRLLVISAVLYAISYSLASGIIVYNPEVIFSTVYHTSIPSSSIAICCGPLGQTPLAVVYLTTHLGIVLVPANLFLLFSLSWLVGLNAALGTFGLLSKMNKTGMGWLGGTAAFVGLFTSCPTCAGLALFSILSGSGTLSIPLFLGPLQALFVAVSVPVLIATPILLARSLTRIEGEACNRA